MKVIGIRAEYPAEGKAKVRQAQDGTQSFEREFMGMASQTPPSFVGKVWMPLLFTAQLVFNWGVNSNDGSPVAQNAAVLCHFISF